MTPHRNAVVPKWAGISFLVVLAILEKDIFWIVSHVFADVFRKLIFQCIVSLNVKVMHKVFTLFQINVWENVSILYTPIRWRQS